MGWVLSKLNNGIFKKNKWSNSSALPSPKYFASSYLQIQGSVIIIPSFLMGKELPTSWDTASESNSSAQGQDKPLNLQIISEYHWPTPLYL